MWLNRFILTEPAFLRLNRAGRASLAPAIGLGIIVAIWMLPFGHAAATLWMGLAGTCLLCRRWSRDREIWRLFCVLGSMIALYACAATKGIAGDLLRKPQDFWPEGIDILVGDAAAFVSLWMIWTASVWNWRWFHRKDGETPQTPPSEPSPVPSWPHEPLPSLSAKARAPVEQEADSVARGVQS
ncbi:MAG: hypothetical protein AABZ53_03600 [Planctomycetota bacterium]